MSKRTYIGATMVGLAVLVTASALVASNMGFKLNYSLNQINVVGDAGPSKTGVSSIALPDNRQSGMNTAKDLMNDVGFLSVTDVRRWVRSADSFAQIYTGRGGSAANFNLAGGEGYLIKMKTTVAYIVVGSDDPTLTTSLVQIATPVDVGISKTGLNFFSYNYHQTAGTAKDLMNDVGFLSVTDIRRWVRSTDATSQIYTGRGGSAANYNLIPGEAYIVKMKTTTAYTPSHY